MQPSQTSNIPSFNERAEALKSFVPDSTGVLLIECNLVEKDSSRYCRELSWSSGNYSAQALAVSASGGEPSSKAMAAHIDLTFSTSLKKLRAAALDSVKFRLAFGDEIEVNGALRSFATSVMNGTDFKSAVQEVRDSFARFGVQFEEIVVKRDSPF